MRAINFKKATEKSFNKFENSAMNNDELKSLSGGFFVDYVLDADGNIKIIRRR